MKQKNPNECGSPTEGGEASKDSLLKKAGKAARDQSIVAASGVAGAGLAVWLAGPGGAPVGAVSGAALGRGLLEYVKSVFGKRVEKRAEAFANEAAVLLHADLGDDSQRAAMDDVLFEAYRSLMAALDDAVVPALARLVALYSGGRRPDRFFRGVGRVLEQIDAQELHVLASALAHLRALSSTLPPETRTICCDFAGNQIEFASAEHWAVGHRKQASSNNPSAARFGEMFVLLAREGIISRSETVVVYDAPLPAYVVHLDQLDRLRAVFIGRNDDTSDEHARSEQDA